MIEPGREGPGLPGLTAKHHETAGSTGAARVSRVRLCGAGRSTQPDREFRLAFLMRVGEIVGIRSPPAQRLRLPGWVIDGQQGYHCRLVQGQPGRPGRRSHRLLRGRTHRTGTVRRVIARIPLDRAIGLACAQAAAAARGAGRRLTAARGGRITQSMIGRAGARRRRQRDVSKEQDGYHQPHHDRSIIHTREYWGQYARIEPEKTCRSATISRHQSPTRPQSAFTQRRNLCSPQAPRWWDDRPSRRRSRGTTP